MPCGYRHLLPKWAGWCTAVIALSQPLGHALADILQPMPLQQVVPGKVVRIPVIWDVKPDRRVQIQLGNAPKNAKLTVSNTGKIFVVWQTPQQMPETTLMDIIATDVDGGDVLDTRQLVVRALKSVELSNGSVKAVTTVDESLAASIVRDIESEVVATTNIADPVDPDTPFIPILPNQVVSAGRVINLRVNASIGDGTRPVLQVDRLPRNASFDVNTDGSRTFYWQTGDRDQGEHVFRFTAFNPNESYLRAEREVLIVVGDPSRNKTLPAENRSSSE